MSLSLFAANALVTNYLDGRHMPDAAHDDVLRAVEARLISGKIPVLDAALRETIDSEASLPAPAMSAASRDH